MQAKGAGRCVWPHLIDMVRLDATNCRACCVNQGLHTRKLTLHLACSITNNTRVFGQVLCTCSSKSALVQDKQDNTRQSHQAFQSSLPDCPIPQTTWPGAPALSAVGPLTSLPLQCSLAGPQLLPEQLNLPPPVGCDLHRRLRCSRSSRQQHTQACMWLGKTGQVGRAVCCCSARSAYPALCSHNLSTSVSRRHSVAH